uniref:RNB domain-containing protein n=1 Tax=Bicosoecida sp. CB-2014 TaxID=1486930 RepID=A0A7S1C3L7_9STRA
MSGPGGETLVGVLEQLAITSMNRAQYFAVCDTPRREWAHYALGIPYYTHFTSPIRRYADVMVHRLLQATLEGGDDVEAMAAALDALPPATELARACERCNTQKQAADDAQNDSARVFLAIYLDAHPTEVDCIVSDVGEKSFKATIPAWGLEQQIYLDKCGLEGRLDQSGKAKRLFLRAAGRDEPPAGAADALHLEVFTPVRVRLLGDLKVVPVAIAARLVSCSKTGAAGGEQVDVEAWVRAHA